MKLRVIDKFEQSLRHDVDETWEKFSNYLITAFGDIHEKDVETMDTVYCRHRIRRIDANILDSLVYNIPPGFADLINEEGIFIEAEKAFIDNNHIHWACSGDAPFLLLGYVGIGKTTFITHYFKSYIVSKDKKIKGVIVNFKVAPTTNDDFIYYMINEINSEINKICPEVSIIDRKTLEILFPNEILQYKASLFSIDKQMDAIDELFMRYIAVDTRKDNDNYKVLVKKRWNICVKNMVILFGLY